MSTLRLAILLGLGLAIGGALAGPSPLLAKGAGMRPPSPSATRPPFDLGDDAIVGEGARLFQQNCTGYCHGKEGRLSRAPKLRGRQFEVQYLYGRIANGFPPMPAYVTVFPPETIWKLVAYIKSLESVKEE
jgi:mono/diheme cytochrome c family protein